MHGLVNKALAGMIEDRYGSNNWNQIREKCQFEDEIFLSDQSYPDQLTYSIVHAASETLSIKPEKLLFEFGEYWILNTGQVSYGSLFRAAGSNVGDFLTNLPGFHNRVMLIYPNIKAPEFVVRKISDDLFEIDYYSQREGLRPFVMGLLSGIGLLFKTTAEIKILASKTTVDQPDTFSFFIKHSS